MLIHPAFQKAILIPLEIVIRGLPNDVKGGFFEPMKVKESRLLGVSYGLIVAEDSMFHSENTNDIEHGENCIEEKERFKKLEFIGRELFLNGEFNMNVDWQTREVKRNHVKNIFTGVKRNYQKYIFGMPGYIRSDLVDGVNLGVLNKSTFIVAAERTKSSYEKIKNHLEENFNDYILSKNLCDLKAFPSVDLAFLDFTGNLSTEILTWMQKFLVNKINNEARIAINVTGTDRGNLLVPSLIEKYQIKLGSDFVKLQKKLFDELHLPKNI